MGGLRASTLILSLAMHGALVFAFVDFAGGRSLETGTGNDLLRIEQGIALEGLARLGDAPEAIEAREVIETLPSAARPELQEIKAAEVKPEEPPPPEATPLNDRPPELKDVISSPLGPAQEIPPPVATEEVRPPQLKQVATEQQIEQVAVLEQKQASQVQLGGDATLYREYLGSIRVHIERFKVKPASPKDGTVVVRFTIDRAGRVTAREVATSSGVDLLDQAALAAIDKASPFPSFPDLLSRDEIVLSIPFRFVTR